MSSGDALGFPRPRRGYTAQEDARLAGGRLPPLPAPEQPPPADMPALPLMVLDALADGPENIYSMRNCGEMTASGVALVGEAHMLDALRSLLADGLVVLETEHVVVGDRVGERRLVGEPGTTDDDLRRYWFSVTPRGREVWEAADVVDGYWDAHPIEPETDRDETDAT